ncbi:methyltransferase domain-containing protein [Candidatus Poribacteria bacterium]|nr:methyltransferase domain-containing protein [Candidatus Poribacteria bacterium]
MIENLPKEYINTDFGDKIYDEWYLTHGRFNFESPEFVRQHIPFYEQSLGLSNKDFILDAGCGIGSYTREFNRKGYNIIGIDLSENFLSEARDITKSEELDIEYILGDYNEMSFEDEFSVIFFEGSFFYKSRDGLVSLLSRIYKALKPNGKLYFVHPNQEIIKKNYP